MRLRAFRGGVRSAFIVICQGSGGVAFRYMGEPEKSARSAQVCSLGIVILRMYVAMLAGVKVARLGHRSDRSRSRSSSSSPRLPL